MLVGTLVQSFMQVNFGHLHLQALRPIRVALTSQNLSFDTKFSSNKKFSCNDPFKGSVSRD